MFHPGSVLAFAVYTESKAMPCIKVLIYLQVWGKSCIFATRYISLSTEI